MADPDQTTAWQVGMLEHAERNAAIAIAREANAKAARAADLEDEIERLRVALVNAAIPLEAIAMTDTLRTLSPQMQDGIHMAITAIRDALGVKADG